MGTAFIGGGVWSAESGVQRCDVLVRDGRIVVVGSLSREQLQGAQVVDLAGATLLPAFGDGHAHPVLGGLEAQFADVRGDSVAAIVDSVTRYAAAHPELAWIQGYGYDPSLSPDGLFDARWLDVAVPDRPVVLRGTDFHTVWCNSEALRRAGIGPDTPQPADGEITKRADGTPLGTLREWGAVDLVLTQLPELTVSERVQALARATERYASLGVTWVQDAWVETAELPVYLTVAEQNRLRCRVNLAFRADPAHWRTQVAEFADAAQKVAAAGHPRLTARTVKFFADGVIEAGTAALIESYQGCPHDHGIANWTPAELAEAAIAFDQAGFQLHVHAIGDAAIRDSLDALAAVRVANGARDRRSVIAHVQLVDPADRPRFAELGVIACFQPLWAQLDPLQTELTIPRLGPERAQRQYPLGELLRSGAPISFGSDWPVSDPNPLAGIAIAISRQTVGGEPAEGWLPAQRVSLAEALTAYSAGTAFQAFRDDAGVIAVGQVADLVAVECDFEVGSADSVRAGRVLGTWLDGQQLTGFGEF